MIRALLCWLRLCPLDALVTYHDPEDGFFYLRCPSCRRNYIGARFSRLL